MRIRMVVGALLLAACGVQQEPSAVRQEIVGGTVDTTAKFPSVFVVKVEHSGGPTAGCTATLITSRTLLTAAHCLPPDTTKISTTNLTPAPSSSPTFVESPEYRRHPSWTSANPAANDIGLILLPTASTLTPYPYDRADLSGFAGKPLTAVGYGVTSPAGTDNGTRRYVDLTFRAVTAAHIALGNQTSKGVCFGDSGGPALHTFPDGITRVVGVHSYTQPASSCTDGLDTRVDLYTAFIKQWLMDKEGGGTCLEDGMCKAGCTPADPDCVCVADGTCSAQCANLLSDPDCPPDCVMNGVCTSLACPAPDPDCTAELGQCTMDAQCAARHCSTDPQRPNEKYCARGCTGGQTQCASGTSCTAGVCLKQQLPSVAPGGTCVATNDFCLGGTMCQAVPMGGTRCTIPCTAATTCPAPTACAAGFCLGGDTKVANPGEVCDLVKTYCTGGTVCAGLAVLGPPTCTEGCVIDDDCTDKKKICQQGAGGVHYCENEIIVLPQLGSVDAPAGKQSGCSTAGGLLAPFVLLGLLRRRRAMAAVLLTAGLAHAGPTPVIDTHADTTQFLLDGKVDFVKPSRADLQVDLPKAKKGGLDAQFLSIWVDPDAYAGKESKRALALIDVVLEQVRLHPAELQLATTADEISAAKKAGKFAVLMGIEGGHAIENDLGLLRTFHRLGVRYMTLTHGNTNAWADSSGDIMDAKVKHHGGLTPFGEDVVREMNRLGMMVDVSHVADETLDDVLKVTKAPVIASHSATRALCDAPRNLTDAQLKAIAKNGGVVQVNFFSGFVDQAWLTAWRAAMADRKAALAALKLKIADPVALADAQWELNKKEAAKIPRPPLKALIDHLDRVAKTAGVEHVGLGSDFDGIFSTPEGIDSVADLPKIAAALGERGYTPAQVQLMMGGNTLRVMRAVEKVAATW